MPTPRTDLGTLCLTFGIHTHIHAPPGSLDGCATARPFCDSVFKSLSEGRFRRSHWRLPRVLCSSFEVPPSL
eukprot:4247522-Pleurochrysis_carterae.AAC.6